jgi:starch synthase
MRRDLSVLFLSPEVVPFSKTGGLADVAGALPVALTHQGCRITVATPFYGDLLTGRFPTKPLNGPLVSVPVGSDHLGFSVRTLEKNDDDSVSFLFGANSEIIARAGLYSEPDGGPAYEDNDARFVLFCRGMMEWIRRAGRHYDILHLNDWQTALIAPYLRTIYSQDPHFVRMRTVLTVHNLAYQGVFPAERFGVLGLGEEELTPLSPFEFWGKLNFLKSGLVYAHKINTVSPTYAHEIQTDEVLGSGLEGVLRGRSRDLTGILNGIDSRIWNPAVDPLIEAPYGPGDAATGKKANKEALLRRTGIPAKRWARPLIGIISRLADQKGFDLIEKAADKLFALDINLIVLGTGEQRFHVLFKRLEKRHPDRIAVFLKFDNALSHQIEAGADMFLMPSRYEPCGLNQMYSLAYGTVPIVRATGGLADTVTDADLNRDTGTGFVFADYKPAAMIDAIRRAVAAFADKVRWGSIRRRGMELDFSWDHSAENYMALYEAALEVDAPAPIHHH